MNPPKVAISIDLNNTSDVSMESNAGNAAASASVTATTSRGRKIRSSAANANAAVLAASKTSRQSRKRTSKDQLPGSASKRLKRTSASGDAEVIDLSEDETRHHNAAQSTVRSEEANFVNLENILHQ